MKWQALRRAAGKRPVAALYLLGVGLLLLYLLADLALDTALYATGLLQEKTVTLADAGQYALIDLEQADDGSLTSVTGDAQLLLTPGTLVRRLRLKVGYTAGEGGEKDLYYHLPGFGYTPLLRVWPAPAADGKDLVYTVPRIAGQNLRLDLADTAGVTLRLEAIVLNERPAWYTYLIPTAWQLFWLAVLPGLAGCALTIRRGLPAPGRADPPA